MKFISGLELRYIIKELNLINSKIEKISELSADSYMFKLHSSSIGKNQLIINLPHRINITEYKHKAIEPNDFCMLLRKHLNNAIIKSLRQIKNERILELNLSKKENEYYLIIELFSKGNIILLDKNKKIITAHRYETWKDRTIKPKESYKEPPSRINILDISLEEFKYIISKSNRELVKLIAVEFGLGGLFAEESLLRANINKDIKREDLLKEDGKLNRLFNEIIKLYDKDIEAYIVKKDTLIDVIPFNMEYYKEYDKEKFESFNKALDYFFENLPQAPKKNPKLIKLNKIIEEQQKFIEEYNKKIEEYNKIIETIYNNYVKLKEIFDNVNNLKAKGWNEVKEYLSNLKEIKGIDLKNKTIVVELNSNNLD